MIMWRISNRVDLNGLGGEKADGRWHTATPGKRIVYCAEHPAVCLIESLVNLKGDPKFFPDAYQLLKISASDQISTRHLHTDLSKNWRDNVSETRALGDSWLAEGDSAILIVPSAPSPESWNYLFNPLHLDARTAAIESHRQIAYDSRLFRFRS